MSKLSTALVISSRILTLTKTYFSYKPTLSQLPRLVLCFLFPKDINPDLLGSVVVAGGTTVMPGFVERLKEDLDKISPVGASMMASVIPHPTRHEPGYNAQRRHAPWIGGSMLASLSPFKQARMVGQKKISYGVSCS